MPADCASQLCTGGICQVPGCGDQVKNGFETGVDCGGPSCAPCGVGEGCVYGADCLAPNLCTVGVCTAPGCGDQVKNGGESDVDCGGATACARCADDALCTGGADCTSGVCSAGHCAVPACSDGVKNGFETATDCGGATSCARCAPGAHCDADGDCAGGKCTPGAQVCAAPSCGDGVQNGLESGVDCGLACNDPCGPGASCLGDADCDPLSYCSVGVCSARVQLTIVLAGAGAGSVWSVPAGLVNCSPNATLCSLWLAPASSLVLHASPALGSSFAGFSGAGCSASPCTVDTSASATVTATFD